MVEAARVGQLSPLQAAQLREHLVSGCAQCKLEKRYFDWLGKALLQGEPPRDEVALRRLRQATLQRAHDEVYRESTVRWPRRWLAGGALVALVVTTAVWQGFGRTPEIVVTRLTAAAPVQRRCERDREVVVLGDGVYELSVRRGIFDRHVVVQVPEGEIEDLGTVFGVSVQQGKTARVAVSQGAVVLHMRGAPEVRLEAGSAWEPQPQLELETLPLPEHAEPVVEGSLPSTPARGSAGPRSEHSEGPLRRARHAQHAQKTVNAPATQHVAAASSVDVAGEDATYLRVLELLQQRRAADAKRLAELYLERFPRGFRRPEIERIARPSDPE